MKAENQLESNASELLRLRQRMRLIRILALTCLIVAFLVFSERYIQSSGIVFGIGIVGSLMVAGIIRLFNKVRRYRQQRTI